MDEPAFRWFRARTLGALGTAMSEVRRDSGFTQEQAGSLTGTSRPTISRMERGRPGPSSAVVDLLTACGYELVVVPRGARVIVEPRS